MSVVKIMQRYVYETLFTISILSKNCPRSILSLDKSYRQSHSGADIAIQWYGVLLPVILNGVKDLIEQTIESNRFFAYAQNDRLGRSE